MAHPSVVINGVQYQSVPQVQIPKVGSGTATFFDATDCDATAANVLSGKVFVNASGEDTGTMANNGATGGTISTKAGSVTIPAGYTTGGSVSIASSAVSDCVAGNILLNKKILGITGSLQMPNISQDATSKILSIS